MDFLSGRLVSGREFIRAAQTLVCVNSIEKQSLFLSADRDCARSSAIAEYQRLASHLRLAGLQADVSVAEKGAQLLVLEGVPLKRMLLAFSAGS